jgi:manganese transport protein
MKIRKQLSAVLFWSVISAAFIGPGTVTTAAAAGASFGIDLIWVLVLSMIACIVLQVNVTRLTIINQKTLGELLLQYFTKIRFVPLALGISIVFGCIAYQVGNLLGATLGLSMVLHLDQRWMLLAIVLLAGLMLWFGSVKLVVKLLGAIVALMGAIFIMIAFTVDYQFSEIIMSSIIPKTPVGSELIVMGLIGTTIVPYNLFLGSGLSKGQELSTSTFGLIFAITIGGIISIAILLVGTFVSEPFGFGNLAETLSDKLGNWAIILLGVGLFSAGFTSSMTAPIAAVFTIQSVFPNAHGLKTRTSASYRLVWMLVMGAGFIFGFLNIKPIPAIILAQAVNGVILPFIATFILYLIASRVRRLNKMFNINTILLIVVVTLIVMIGAFNLCKLLFDPGINIIFVALLIGFAVTLVTLMFAFFRKTTLD